MRRFVLTGAPGSGKTTVLGVLREQGLAVVEEAATEVISRGQRAGVARPWEHPGFIGQVTRLQREWRLRPVPEGTRVQVHDRSPLCTLALARYLGQPVPPLLAAEIETITRENLYERRVFLLGQLGFITPTAARRISYADATSFATLHEQVYLEHGHDIIHVPAGPAASRAAAITARITSSG